MEIKIQRALEVIVDNDGLMPDDTYLDKIVSGLERELFKLKDDTTKKDKLWQPFSDFIHHIIAAENCGEELLSFVFKLVAQCLPRHEEVILEDGLYLLNMNSDQSSYFVMAKSILHNSSSSSVVDLSKLWRLVLKPGLLKQQSSYSHFWRQSFVDLATVYLEILLRSHPKLFVQCLNDDIDLDNEMCQEIMVKTLKGCLKLGHFNCENVVVDKIKHVCFETTILVHLIHGDLKGAECCLLLNSDNKSSKEWIRGCKMYMEHVNKDLDDKLYKKCLDLVDDESSGAKYLTQLSTIQCDAFKRQLWRHILDQIIAPPLLLIYFDAKLISRCLTSLHLLLPATSNVEEDLEKLIQLSLLAEMSPLLKSRTLALIQCFVENKKHVVYYVEDLAYRLWSHTRNESWEVQDAFLSLLSCEKLASKKQEECLTHLAVKSVASDNSFVRASAFVYIKNLWRFQQQPKVGNVEKLLANVFEKETEAIVRRSAAEFAAAMLNSSEMNEIMLVAMQDLDWEVKEKSCAFWILELKKCVLASSNFQQLVEKVHKSKAHLALLLMTSDCDLSLKSVAYKQLENVTKEFHDKKFSDVPNRKKLDHKVILKLEYVNFVAEEKEENFTSKISRDEVIETIMNTDTVDQLKKSKKAKLIIEEKRKLKNLTVQQTSQILLLLFTETNYGEMLKQLEDDCDLPLGLESVLDDVIQLDRHESKLDGIDCF